MHSNLWLDGSFRIEDDQLRYMVPWSSVLKHSVSTRHNVDAELFFHNEEISPSDGLYLLQNP